MWSSVKTVLIFLAVTTTTTVHCIENKPLSPPATNYGIPDYRQTRSLGEGGVGQTGIDLIELSPDLSGISTDLSGLTTSYSPIASGVDDDSLTSLSGLDDISSNANAYSDALNGFTNYGGDLSALQSVQQVPVVSAYQQVQQVPVIAGLQTVQQVPVIAAVQQQQHPVVVAAQPVAVGAEGRSLGGVGGIGALGGLAGAGAGFGGAGFGGGFGGGFKRYRTSIHIRSRGFGGGLGGFGGLGGLGGFKGFGGGFGGGRFKAHYSESAGGGFAGAGGVAGAGLLGGAAGGLLG